MLHDDDRTLVARDGALPGLALLLDEEALATAIHDAVPASAITSLRAHYLRYKPATNCLCCYLATTESGTSTILYAKAFTADDPGLQKQHHPIAPSELGDVLPGTLLLADPHVRVWAFPNDQRVRALDRVGDPEQRRRMLRRTLPDRVQWWGADLALLAYKPDRRFVGRLDLGGQAVATLRLYTRAGYARAIERASFVAECDAPELPPVHGHSERHGAIVYGWMPGRSLLDDLIEGKLHSDRFEAAGGALARLHRLSPRQLPRHHRDHEMTAIRAAAAEIESLVPELAARARDVVAMLAAILRQRDGGPPATLHGDFYPKQAVASPSAVGLIDLDGACSGDRCRDLGNFLAHLERYRRAGRVEDTLAERAGLALLAGYRGDGGRVDPVLVSAHQSAGLLRLASHPFRRRERDWKRALECLLEAAERAARSTTPGSRSNARTPAIEAITPFARATRAAPCVAAVARIDLGGADAVFAEIELEGVRRWVRLDGCGPVEVSPWRDRRLPLCHALPPSERARARVLGYRPERRVVLAVEREGATWIEKGYAVGRAESAARAHRRAEAALAGSAVGAAPLHEERTGTASLVFGVVEGARPRLDSGAASMLCRLGRGLRSLQEAPPLEGARDEPRSFTAADELEVLGRWRGKALRLRDALPAGWDQQRERCAAALREVPAVEFGLAHRDLHDGQLLIAGDAVTLLDFDLLCRAEVALDAGNFSAHLHLRSLQRRLSSEVDAPDGSVEALRHAFLDGLDRGHEPAFMHRLACYEASSSLRLALVYFLRPRWESLAGALIAHSERCLENCS